MSNHVPCVEASCGHCPRQLGCAGQVSELKRLGGDFHQPERQELRTRTELFKRSQALVGRLPTWVRTLHSFFWLHILTSSDLDDITMDSYQGSTGFESEQHNLQPLWSWEESAFQQCLSKCKSVLVAGAGGGREMIALSRMGLQVVGFDASTDLVKACLQNVKKANTSSKILLAPPGEAPDGLAIHDALVIGRGVYHHIPGRARRIKFLKSCRKNVQTGSPLIIGDFLMRGAKRPLTTFAFTKEVEPGDTIGISFLHYFSPEEIRTELKQAGFELLEFRRTPFLGGSNLAHALARSTAGPGDRHL